MFMTEVRQIKPDEWQLLKRVRLAALADAPEAFSSTLDRETAFADGTWRQYTREGAEGVRSFCALALDGEEPAGIAVGLSDEKDTANSYLVSMWVAPASRGTHVAPLLVEAVANWATRLGASLLLAGLTPGNERAVAFYKKTGFETFTGPRPDHPAINTCNLVIARRV
jgi:GNAT superfamily N-acetyltransferase